MRKKWQRGYKGCHLAEGQLMSFLSFLFVSPSPFLMACLFALRFCLEKVSFWMTTIRSSVWYVNNYVGGYFWNAKFIECGQLWWWSKGNSESLSISLQPESVMIKLCEAEVDAVHECNYVPLCFFFFFQKCFICLAQFNLVFPLWCLASFASKKIYAYFQQILPIIAVNELTTRFINFTLKVLYLPVHL